MQRPQKGEKDIKQLYDMSWCTAAELAELISVARLRGDVDAASRKSADLRFIEVCTSAVNAGDVLLQIATESTASPGLRLNAIFAAQPLLTKKGWSEGGQFSDRSAVTQHLLRLTADPSFNTSTKINIELLRSLALVVSLEFPTEEWQRWIEACARAFSAGSLVAFAKIRAVVSESYCNCALWSFLANDMTGFLLRANLSALPERTAVLTIFLELMRKRPRPSAENEIATASNCVLLSEDMRHFVMGALATRVEEARVAGAPAAGFVEDCTAAFAVACRLVVDVESAAAVFRCSSFFLTLLQDTAARGDMSDELTALTEQLLECVLSTLQVFPEVASSDVQAEALLTCLIHFMIPGEESERAEAAQLSAEILEFFMDDEAVPLGCGSGDVAHLAGAVLELYLEHNAAQRTAAVATLNSILRSTPTIRGVLADAVALALRSVSRVYEAAEAVVVDALDANTQAELLTQVSQLLLRTTDPHARIMLMDAMTHCFYRSSNEAICRQLVQLLEQLHASVTAIAPSASTAPSLLNGCALCVRCACLYEAGRLVEEVRAQSWSGSLLSPTWATLAVEQLAAGKDTFSAFCAASLLCSLLDVSPGRVQYLCVNDATTWEHGLQQLCRHATLRGVAVLLTLMLKHLSGVSAAASPSAPPSPRASRSPHECAVVVQSCGAVMQFCQRLSPSRHLVLRCVVDFVAAHTRVLLRGAGGGGCTTCAQHLVDLSAPLLMEEYSSELVQDEPSCRGFVVSLTLQCVGFGSVRPTMVAAACVALLRALTHAVQHGYASQTISCVCSHLSVLLLLQPALLEEVPLHVLHILFTDKVNLVEGRKGVSYSGLAFLLSLVFLRFPRLVFDAAGAATTATTAAALASHDETPLVVQRAFGWWLSLAPFMDAIQFPYFAAACCRVVDLVAISPDQLGGSAASPLAFCRHFFLPSLHVKTLPPRFFTSLSVQQHLSLAWVDLERRYGSTGKPQLLDKELQSCVAGVGQHYTSLCGEDFVGTSTAALLKTTSTETVAAFLSYLGQSDGGATVHTARQLLSTAVR